MMSMLLTVQPALSVALAAVIFGESPSALQLFGVVLILAALLAARRPGRALDDELPIGSDLMRPADAAGFGAGAASIVAPDD
jgi:hypothetical protein